MSGYIALVYCSFILFFVCKLYLSSVFCYVLCVCVKLRTRNSLLVQSLHYTFTKAFEIAQSVEAAAKDAADLRKLVPVCSSSVQHLQSKRYACYRCGGNHLANICSFKSAECRACGKKGHIARVCKSKIRQTSRQPSRDALKQPAGACKPQQKPVHSLTSDQSPVSTSDLPLPSNEMTTPTPCLLYLE